MEFLQKKLLIVGVDKYNPVSEGVISNLEKMGLRFDKMSFVGEIKDEYFDEIEHFTQYELIVIVGMERHMLGNNLSRLDDYAFPHMVVVIGDHFYSGMVEGSDADKKAVSYCTKQVNVDIGETYFKKIGFGLHKKTFLDEYQNMLISQESYSKKSA